MKITVVSVVLLAFMAVDFTVAHYDGRFKKPVGDFAKEFLEFRFENAPEYATKFGIEVDDEATRTGVTDIGDAAAQSMLVKAEDLLKNTTVLDGLHLNGVDRVTLQLIRHMLDTYIAGAEFKDYGQFTTEKSYLTEMLEGLWGMPKLTARNADDFINRMKNQAKLISDKLIVRLRNSSAKNIADHSIAVDFTTKDIDAELAQIQNGVDQSKFKKAFNRFPHYITMQKEADFTAAQDIVKDALVELNTFLKDEYNPRTAIGASSLPNGMAYYLACLKFHLSVNVTQEAVQAYHDQGKEYVADTEKEIKELIKSEQPDGDIKAYYTKLYNNKDNFYPSVEAMTADIQSNLDFIHNKLDQVFTVISKTKLKLEVNSMPGHTAYYKEPRFNFSSSGIYSVNSEIYNTLPKFEFAAMQLNEAEPGQHSQSVTIKNSDLADFRQIVERRNPGLIPFNWPFYTACSEGWALYAESLGSQLGAYSEANELFGYYANDLFRSARMVVDTGIHGLGWTRQQAVDYFTAHSMLSAERISIQVDLIITRPGQALGDKVGEHHFKQLYREAQTSMGSLFNEREFHDWMLKVGFVSLEQLNTENFQYEKRMRYLLRKKLEREEKAKKEQEAEDEKVAKEAADKKKMEEELKKLRKSYNSATSITLSFGVLSLITVNLL